MTKKGNSTPNSPLGGAVFFCVTEESTEQTCSEQETIPPIAHTLFQRVSTLRGLWASREP
jgi:hypothetical protein